MSVRLFGPVDVKIDAEGFNGESGTEYSGSLFILTSRMANSIMLNSNRRT